MDEQELRPAPRLGWGLLDIVLVLVGPVIVGVIGLFVAGVVGRVAGWDLDALLKAEPVVVGLGFGGALYLLFLAGIAVLLRWRGLTWAQLGLRRPPLLPVLLVPVLAFGQLIAVGVANLAVMLALGLTNLENPQIKSLTGGQGFAWRNFLTALVVAAVLAPIVEELIFRGLIFGWLRSRLPLWLAVIVSAAVFAAAHVIPILFPALFVMGVILALAYQRTNSLVVNILLHAAQNTFAVTAIFIELAKSGPQ